MTQRFSQRSGCVRTGSERELQSIVDMAPIGEPAEGRKLQSHSDALGEFPPMESVAEHSANFERLSTRSEISALVSMS